MFFRRSISWMLFPAFEITLILNTFSCLQMLSRSRQCKEFSRSCGQRSICGLWRCLHRLLHLPPPKSWEEDCSFCFFDTTSIHYLSSIRGINHICQLNYLTLATGIGLFIHDISLCCFPAYVRPKRCPQSLTYCDIINANHAYSNRLRIHLQSPQLR